MSTHNASGVTHDVPDSSHSPSPPSAIEPRIPKNFSTSNLLSYSPPNAAMAMARNRQSLDANTIAELDRLSKSPLVSEHTGEHGLGLSGLRRIRQHHPPSHPASAMNSAAPSRSGSINLSFAPRQFSSGLGSVPTSPALAFSEDLSRFPTESLHSFSFATQSEEALHNRQNVLKRSLDFMRDKKGWAASNPGLVSAQARLSGDAGAQSVIELLSRSNLIGEDANQAHGLGLRGPVTGPADMTGENPFDRSFNIPRSESPGSMQGSESPRSLSRQSGSSSDLRKPLSSSTNKSDAVGADGLGSPPKAAPAVISPMPAAPVRPRLQLKRTFTDTEDMVLQSKLNDTLARPYTAEETPSKHVTASAEVGTYALTPVTSAPDVMQSHLGHHAAAPHGHGSRWAPAAQAIFTTEANAPWTITAANDLACLVFGVTQSEVRRLGILEVVKEERRKWLEEKLRDPEAGSNKERSVYSQRNSPSATTTLNVGQGLTAKLLSKPPSRSVAAGRRSQTENGSGAGMYANRSQVKGGLNHTAHKSRGVLLCGDVVPIQKRNGALGSASLWVKEKKGGLIWVLEEIAEDVAYVTVDEVGCVMRAKGSVEAIWGHERLRAGTDIQRLIPDIPRKKGTHTGVLDFPLIDELRAFTAKTANNVHIPITVEELPSDQSTFRVSSFPHIAGIMVLNSSTLKIQSSNSVFSAALFGHAHPEGLHINDILPGFDKILSLMTDEDEIKLVEGIVIPEHSFRRARALLAMREGRSNAAAIFLRPTGMPAKHRDGSEITVDAQMRVVKSERGSAHADESAIVEEAVENGDSHSGEVVYALWVTYSRQLHAVAHGSVPIAPQLSRPGTPPHQPSPGQTTILPQLDEIDGEDSPSSQRDPSAKAREAQNESPTRAEATSATTRDLTSTTTSATKPAEPAAKKSIADFVILEDMGQGAYGQVKLCRYKKPPQNKVVIKYVTKRRILVDTWTRDRKLGTVPLEIHVLDYLRRDGLKHPNVVEMVDFFEDDVNYYIEMVPHGYPGMDLFDYIELRVNMEEDECRKIFVQVANAVWHLHITAKVVHRDIKDENVILDGEGNIKLIDFGSAAYIRNGPFDVFVGTIDYAAPEVLAGQSYRGKEQDVWALGILLYTILYKENPFYSIDEIMDHDLRVPYVMSEASIDLVRRMLNRDVDRRITIGEVLEHDWCRGVGGEVDGP